MEVRDRSAEGLGGVGTLSEILFPSDGKMKRGGKGRKRGG